MRDYLVLMFPWSKVIPNKSFSSPSSSEEMRGAEGLCCSQVMGTFTWEGHYYSKGSVMLVIGSFVINRSPALLYLDMHIQHLIRKNSSKILHLI